mmetsp:Transcript_12736/g.36557  ORF Transcript_12736/g.36557 Transcript_12736/m.36557 type:complete len:225 (+) Transcript_12736:1058-1732(+)
MGRSEEGADVFHREGRRGGEGGAPAREGHARPLHQAREAATRRRAGCSSGRCTGAGRHARGDVRRVGEGQSPDRRRGLRGAPRLAERLGDEGTARELGVRGHPAGRHHPTHLRVVVPKVLQGDEGDRRHRHLRADELQDVEESRRERGGADAGGPQDGREDGLAEDQGPFAEGRPRGVDQRQRQQGHSFHVGDREALLHMRQGHRPADRLRGGGGLGRPAGKSR